MATMMCTRTSVETKEMEGTTNEFKTLFPEFLTLQGSCNFIKKIIAVSVSAITYLREIFPKEAYGERDLYGVKLKILSENCKIGAVSKFIGLIRSCYDAVEKKYLQQLTIGICTDPSKRDELVESYTLMFKYKDNQCAIITNEELKVFSPKLGDPTVDATLLMLKSIVTVQELIGKLPKDGHLTVQLLYYDDVTPSDYEPPGFEPASYEQFKYPEKPMKISLGKIDTKHHAYQFLLKTVLKSETLSQHNSEDPMLPSSQVSNKCSAARKNYDNSGDYHSSQEILSEKSPIRSQREDNKLHCPCGLKLGDQANSIACVSCGKKQHKTCYGILKPEDIPSVFYCVNCILCSTDENSNMDLVYLNQGEERQNLCLLRRCLALCLSLEGVTIGQVEKLLGCDRSTAQWMLEHLNSEGYVKRMPGMKKYILDEDFLNSHGLVDYFPSKDNKENEFSSTNLTLSNIVMDEEDPIESISQRCSQDIHSVEMVNPEKLENSVKNLSISTESPKVLKRGKRKRSVSSKYMDMEDSSEHFTIQKRRRTKKS